VITGLFTRRGATLRVLCATALLAGLMAPAAALAADDDAFATAPALTPVQQTESLNSVTDRFDRFSVELAADDVLTLDLSGPAFQDFDLSVYSPGVAVAEPGAEDFHLVARSNAPATPEENLTVLVPPGGGGTYYVELSTQAGAAGPYELSWTLESAIGDAVRISGIDRYTTSYAASRSSFTTASAVVIASGANFPDALSAAGLAGALDCPVLLAPPVTSADDPRLGPLYAEMTRLRAGKAYVVGGTSAVNDLMFDQIETWVTSAERIPGATRYETAKNVAEEIDDINGHPSTVAFVVRGDSFADALAVSPFAFSQAIPILLTSSSTLDPYTSSYLELHNVGTARIAGGTGAVSTAVASQLDGLNSGATVVYRMQGATRYETAAKVASDCIGLGWGSWDSIGVATGANFPDALSGGAALGTRGGSLLLTERAVLSDPAETAIEDNAGGATKVLVLGGVVAVNDSVVSSIRGLLP